MVRVVREKCRVRMEKESVRTSWRRGHLSRDLKGELGKKNGKTSGRKGGRVKGRGRGQVVQTRSVNILEERKRD